MNKEIEMLYKTLDAKDKIINEQVLEIARLKEKIDKAIEKLEKVILYGEYIIIHTDLIYDLKNILGDKE